MKSAARSPACLLALLLAHCGTSTNAPAQTSMVMPVQPAFVEVPGTFPSDGHLYDPPSTPPPANAYLPPDIPSNFRVQDWLASRSDGGGDPVAADKKFRTTCYSVKVMFADPILGHNRPNWGHLHEFGGNTGVSYDSTYFSLRTTGNGSCGGGKINRSSYWWPAMLDAVKGKVVRSAGQTVYYTREADNPIGLPNGLHYISGYNLGDRTNSKLTAEARGAWTTNGDIIGWHCDSSVSGNQVASQSSFLTADGSDRMNDCHGYLYVEINFPDCWDRTNLSAPDGRANVRFSEGPLSNGGLSNRRCPPGYSPIPQFQIKIRWHVDGYAEYKNWYVSSDRMPGNTQPSGTTMHSDWFGAWDSQIRDTWLARCVGATTARGITPRQASCDYTSYGNGWRGMVDDPAPDGSSSPKVVRSDLYLGDDKYQAVPGISMPGFLGIAAGTDMSDMMHGAHSMKAAGQHTPH